VKARGALQRFWKQDWALSVMLALLVILVFVLPPFTVASEERSPLADVALTLLLAAGVAGLQVRPWTRSALLLTAVAAMSVRLMPATSAQVVALSSLVSLGLMAAVVLYQTFRGSDVSVHHVQGAVAAYPAARARLGRRLRARGRAPSRRLHERDVPLRRTAASSIQLRHAHDRRLRRRDARAAGIAVALAGHGSPRNATDYSVMNTARSWSGCRRAATKSTRPSRRATRSSCAPGTCSRRCWCSRAPPGSASADELRARERRPDPGVARGRAVVATGVRRRHAQAVDAAAEGARAA
jgi:hypothetical protein